MHKVIVIGGGPAGLAAAIQLHRQGDEPLLIEKNRIGGLLWNANLVENYPGFPAGITGPRLAGLFEKQLFRLGVPVIMSRVSRLDMSNEYPLVVTDRGEYLAHYVVVASGTRANSIPLPIPAELSGRVFTEVFPLISKENKRIAIVGAGDAAFDYALNLSRRNSVTILNRGDSTRCLPLLFERAMKIGQITYVKKTQLLEVNTHAAGDFTSLKCLQNGKTVFLDTDFLIFAIGRKPETEFATSLTGPDTENDKIRYIGDVKNGLFRQSAIAVGEGIRVAMELSRKLSQINLEVSTT